MLDFGIARLTQGGRSLTRTGAVVGTPGYLAPELVRGERNINASADVFSLGCVLFQCLTGRPVFEAEESSALLAKILLQDAPRVRELVPRVPPALDELVARMLAKEPERPPGRHAGGHRRDRRARPDHRRGRWRRGDRACTRRSPTASSASPASCWPGRRPARIASGAGITVRISATAATKTAAGPVPPVVSMIEALETELASAHGARVHALPDGSMVVTLPDAGKSTDQAATRRALRACACAPRSPTSAW